MHYRFVLFQFRVLVLLVSGISPSLDPLQSNDLGEISLCVNCSWVDGVLIRDSRESLRRAPEPKTHVTLDENHGASLELLRHRVQPRTRSVGSLRSGVSSSSSSSSSSSCQLVSVSAVTGQCNAGVLVSHEAIMTESGLSPLDASQNEPRTGSAKATISSHPSKLSKVSATGISEKGGLDGVVITTTGSK